jgi:hypothetical protein
MIESILHFTVFSYVCAQKCTDAVSMNRRATQAEGEPDEVRQAEGNW